MGLKPAVSSFQWATRHRASPPGAIKKPLPMTKRRGDKTIVLLLIFPGLMMPGLELAPVIETKVQSVAVVSSGQSLNHSS